MSFVLLSMNTNQPFDKWNHLSYLRCLREDHGEVAEVRGNDGVFDVLAVLGDMRDELSHTFVCSHQLGLGINIPGLLVSKNATAPQ